MKYFLKTIFLVAAASIATTAWAVNKCTAADGKVMFQDAPCAINASPKPDVSTANAPKVATSKLRPAMGDPAYEKAREAERSKHIDDYAKTSGAALAADLEAFESKCGKGSLEPRLGASVQWIRKCSWGEPNEVRTVTTAQGKSEQWRYKTRGTLFFDASGKVTTILN